MNFGKKILKTGQMSWNWCLLLGKHDFWAKICSRAKMDREGGVTDHSRDYPLTVYGGTFQLLSPWSETSKLARTQKSSCIREEWKRSGRILLLKYYWYLKEETLNLQQIQWLNQIEKCTTRHCDISYSWEIIPTRRTLLARRPAEGPPVAGTAQHVFLMYAQSEC